MHARSLMPSNRLDGSSWGAESRATVQSSIPVWRNNWGRADLGVGRLVAPYVVALSRTRKPGIVNELPFGRVSAPYGNRTRALLSVVAESSMVQPGFCTPTLPRSMGGEALLLPGLQLDGQPSHCIR